MKTCSVVPMRIAKYGYIVISIAFCILGLIMAIFRVPSITFLGVFIGVSMLVFGIVKLVGYFSKDLYRLAFQFDLQFGILLSALGIIILLKPEKTMSFICVLFGISIISDALFKMSIAFEAKEFGIKEWWLIFSLTVLTFIIGAIVVFRPYEAFEAMIILFGASLFTEGLLNLSVALRFVKIVKNQKPDIIEVDEFEEL